MKRVLLPLLLAFLPVWLNAQTVLETRLSSQMQPASTRHGTVSDAEKRLVISHVATTLSKHVAFRRDGTECSAYDTPEGRHYIEWMDLRIQRLTVVPLGDADKKRGVTKRIQAQLAYDQCRLRDPKSNSWGVWGVTCHALFPAAINLEWIGGRVVVDGGMHLDQFKPGPMTSDGGSPGQLAVNAVQGASEAAPSVQQQPISKPGSIQRGGVRSDDLPPGMTRQ